jgi:transposase
VRTEAIPTNATALRRALSKIRGRSRVVCESGPLAAWIKGVLQTQWREVVVCDRRRTRLAARGSSKSDRFDADALSECLRIGTVHPVFVPQGPEMELRRLAKHYTRMVAERRRVIQRLRALFLESGVRVPPNRRTPHRVPMRRLAGTASKAIARAYVEQLECITAITSQARTLLLMAAAEFPAYELLQTVPYVGEIRAATLIACIGDPWRFASRREVWAYGGLGVIQRVSAEHRVLENGQVIRNEKSYGVRLLRAAQPLLKKIFRDIALYASVGRRPFRKTYEAHIRRGKRPAIARLALARKIASVIMAVWRNQRAFSAVKFKRKKSLRGEHQAVSSAVGAKAPSRLHP